jgi:hypothetical protein
MLLQVFFRVIVPFFIACWESPPKLQAIAFKYTSIHITALRGRNVNKELGDISDTPTYRPRFMRDAERVHLPYLPSANGRKLSGVF